MVYRRFNQDGTSNEYLLDHSRESNVFFVNEGGKLRNLSPRSGADFAGNSRSSAYLDLDDDGDLDVAVNNFHAEAVVLRNDSEKRGRSWLKPRLVGDPARRTNRDAIGARIVVTTEDGSRLRREVQGGSGYLSMNPKQQHFGLGRSRKAHVQNRGSGSRASGLRDGPGFAAGVLEFPPRFATPLRGWSGIADRVEGLLGEIALRRPGRRRFGVSLSIVHGVRGQRRCPSGERICLTLTGVW